jgi:hypothetical protein
LNTFRNLLLIAIAFVYRRVEPLQLTKRTKEQGSLCLRVLSALVLENYWIDPILAPILEKRRG